MSYGAEAADQVVRITLNGVEAAARITGKAAERLAALIYSIIKDNRRTKGKGRLSNMLKSGKELAIFTIKDRDMPKFMSEAKRYGILYCVLKDRKANDGVTDIMVRETDSSKVKVFEGAGIKTGHAILVPEEVKDAIKSSSGWLNVPMTCLVMIGVLLIWVMAIVILISCFGRLFKMFMYVAISPIPLSTFAGKPTQSIGKGFLKSFAGVCMEGVVILLACAVYSAYGSTSMLSTPDNNLTNAGIIWNYFADLMIYLFILAAAIKTADRVAKEMMRL